jgi:cytochrome c oxidase subunit II
MLTSVGSDGAGVLTGRGVGRGLGLVLALALAGAAGCGRPYDTFAPVTTQGRAIADFWGLVLVPSAFILLLVAGLLTYVIVRFRATPGAPDPPPAEPNRRLEIAWTAAPVVLLTVLAVLMLGVMQVVKDNPNAQAAPGELRIRVIGHQWWWEYQYPELAAVTANELHVPIGRPLLLQIESDDVLHSFWVPQIGWKRDAIPGKINTMSVLVDQPGVYDGACAQYCLVQHAWMRIRMVAEPGDQFDAWVRQQAAPASSGAAAAPGQQLFVSNTCVNCHSVRGVQATAAVGPDLTHIGSRSQIGSGVLPNTPENLQRWVHQVQDVKPGVRMPNYPNLSDADARALADWLESLQ